MRKTDLGIFLFWFVGISIPLTYLMGFHTFAFQTSPVSRVQEHSSVKAGKNQWTLVHLMSAKCGCSKRTTKYLASRKPLDGHKEVVFVFDGSLPAEPELVQSGYDVVHMSGDEAFEKYNISSVPQLVVFSPKGELKYSGGYNDARIDSYEDLNVLKLLKEEKIVAAYPVFGCANGQKISKLIDPWGLKYGDAQ